MLTFNQENKTRFLSLDLLRGVAVILVLGRHIPDWSAVEGSVIGYILKMWKLGGWTGVDLFFVLSGFLVSSLLFREQFSTGAITVKRFYFRRGMKIYPAFYFFLLVTIVQKLTAFQELDKRAVFSEVFFLQSYIPGLWNHTWSLAVEEHFYLLLPLCIMVWFSGEQRQANKRVVITVVTVFLFCLIFRLINLKISGFSESTQVFPSHLRIDSLFAGVLLSYFYFRYPQEIQTLYQRFRKVLLVFAGVAVIWPFFLALESSTFLQITGFNLLYLGFAIVLFEALRVPFDKGKSVIVFALAFVGRYSYSIYLWHMPMKFWPRVIIERLTGMHITGVAEIALYFACSIGVGWAMARLIEMPLLRVRDSLFPSAAV
jgi:peptidoglycan/LPS O-acetylase OafA/YrhL